MDFGFSATAVSLTELGFAFDGPDDALGGATLGAADLLTGFPDATAVAG
jgi:hypothetical protein